MSAIDQFSHVHVANFFHLPVYWLLEKAFFSDLTDYCTEDDVIDGHYLCIGGGGGEHPALILDNDAVLFQFFLRNIERQSQLLDYSNSTDANIKRTTSNIVGKYMDKENNYTSIDGIYYYKFNQNQWPLESFIKINSEFIRMKSIEGTLENKIIDTVALFLIYEMPLDKCIRDLNLIEIAQLIKTNKWSKIFGEEDVAYRLVGFSRPLGCQTGGKIIKNGETIFGYSLSDWKNDQMRNKTPLL